jgi:phage shock protein C
MNTQNRSPLDSLLVVAGVVLVVLGIFALAPRVLGPLWAPISAMLGFFASIMWPLFIIAVGLFILFLAQKGAFKGGVNNMDFKPSMPVSGTRFTRSRRDKILGGVCGGIAEYFSVSATIVRIIAVIGLLIPSVPVAIAYVIMWLVVPQSDSY